jgi:hypothetical protein
MPLLNQDMLLFHRLQYTHLSFSTKKDVLLLHRVMNAVYVQPFPTAYSKLKDLTSTPTPTTYTRVEIHDNWLYDQRGGHQQHDGSQYGVIEQVQRSFVQGRAAVLNFVAARIQCRGKVAGAA